ARVNDRADRRHQRRVNAADGETVVAISLASPKSTTALSPPRILVYGVAGIGKTTFATSANKPVVLLTEDGLGTIKVPHFPLARSYDEVMAAIAALYTEPHEYKTVVVDSVPQRTPSMTDQAQAAPAPYPLIAWTVRPPRYGSGWPQHRNQIP